MNTLNYIQQTLRTLKRKWNILINWFSDELNDYQPNPILIGNGTVPSIIKHKTGAQIPSYDKLKIIFVSIHNVNHFFPQCLIMLSCISGKIDYLHHYYHFLSVSWWQFWEWIHICTVGIQLSELFQPFQLRQDIWHWIFRDNKTIFVLQEFTGCWDTISVLEETFTQNPHMHGLDLHHNLSHSTA